MLAVARSSASDAFWAALPATADQEAAARHELVKQAKLMFELGISSSSVTAETLRTMYDTAPSDELNCGVSARPAVSDACRSWGTSNHLDGPIGLCQRLLSTHIAGAVFDVEVDRCLDLLSRPELGGGESCAAEYRDLVEKLDERLLAKALLAILMPAGSSTISGLGVTLSHIDHWYAAAAKAFAGNSAVLSDANGRVLSAFWKQVYAVGAPLPSLRPGRAVAIRRRTSSRACSPPASRPTARCSRLRSPALHRSTRRLCS